MAKKQFKTESKKLLDMMINSIYTHKEIFLREIISNAARLPTARYRFQGTIMRFALLRTRRQERSP